MKEDVTTYHVSGTSCKLLDEDVTRCQERLASYLKKMLQRIRNVLRVTRRSVSNVSGTSGKLLGTRCGKVAGSSCMLLQEAVPTYHVSGTPCKLLEEEVTTYRVSGTSCKLLDEDVTTYQERLASYLKKILKMYQERLASYLKKRLQRIRNIWQATWNKMWQGSRIVLHVASRSCSNVSRIRNALQVT